MAFFGSSYCFGQWPPAWAVEAGAELHHAEPRQLDAIRPTGSYYGAYNNPFLFYSPAHRFFAGGKIQIRSHNQRFALLGGIRYSFYQSRYENEFDYSGNPSVFYFRVDQTENTIEYVRLSELKQQAHYVSLPLEFRFIPFNKRTFRPFLRAGIEYATRVGTATKPDFVDDTPSVSASDIHQLLGAPSGFLVSGFMGIGFLIEPRISFEISLPGFILAGSPSKLIDPVASIGCQVTYFIPSKAK